MYGKYFVNCKILDIYNNLDGDGYWGEEGNEGNGKMRRRKGRCMIEIREKECG